MSTRDVIQLDDSHDERYRLLRLWSQYFDFEPMIANYHRLQVERFVFDAVSDRRPLYVGDVGQEEAPRKWLKDRGLCESYATLGLSRDSDIRLDLLQAVPGDLRQRFDCLIATEVLEHVSHPFAAIESIAKLTKAGGLLLGTTPFCWPDHRTENYEDYWRFTRQGLERLLADWFEDISIRAVEWTSEGAGFYEMLRRFEGFGLRAETSMSTGFLFSAHRPGGERS